MAYIPYGAYWCTPFARWQGSLAHLNSIEFAARVGKAELGKRDIEPEGFDFCAFGQTVWQPGSFFAGPWFTAMLGAAHLGAPSVSQACATGARLLSTAVGEIAQGAERCLVVSGDRTSNGPNVYYPAPHAPGATGKSENIVMDNFGHDPWACNSMLTTGENVAARDGITAEEQAELTIHRSEQYAAARADNFAFQRRYMPVLEVPDHRGRPGKTLETDEGVEPLDPDKVRGLRPVQPDGTISFAGQTHPADGNAGMVLVNSAGLASEISGGGPVIEVLAVGHAREEAGYMPAAPIKATRHALTRAGLEISDIDAFKSHNPFAVNDISFARAYDIDWRTMNNFGCSLIWGHPQGPTGLRAMIELIEELEMRGGGTGLFQGCAAGDSAMAVIMRLH